MTKAVKTAGRVRRWMAAAAVLAIVAVAAVLAGRGEAATAAAIETAPAARRTLRSQVQATGVVRARTGAEVKVGARISGRVERLLANVGDRVKRGAPIAQLEDRDLRARVARADADLAAARAQLALVQRGARAEEIQEAEAAVAQAEAEDGLASVSEGRTRSLAEQGYVGREDADRARRDADVARARLASARSRLMLVRNRALPEEVALADARVRQAQAARDEAAASLSYATIAAPIEGVIAQVATQEGETVSAGLNAPTFVTLIDLDRLEVAAYVDEVDVGRVRTGQRATFTVDAFPDVDFAGAITAVYPRAVIQSNVVNYITTIAIEDSKGRLKPDMTATVTIALDERTDVVAVPDRAVRRERGKTVVRIATEAGGTREVKTGLRGGGFTEIVSGIAEGERVVLAEAARQREER
ncbi:MAG: efflux RND transporter periplasmic adaptor subunit [Myxococcales bacterium]